MLQILAAHHPGETQIALLRDGTLEEFYLHRPTAPDGIGAIHVARVTAKIPAMAGAFVALRDAEAFLPDTEGAKDLTEGAYVTVQITRAAQGGKGPRVTARLSGPAPPPEGPPRLLHPGPTPLEELRQAYPAATLTKAPFPEAIAAEIEALASPNFDLPGGLQATMAATAALTAIDLDAGAATAARAPKPVAQFAANRDALPELARQIRLRNLSGAILIDFAGMPAKRRAALAAPLTQALTPDRLHPRLAGFSNLGFAEILRPRRRPPLHELLRGPHAAGLAALRHAAAEAAQTPASRLALRAAPPVIAALQADPASLAALAHITTHPLLLRSDPTLPATAWTIETALA